MISESHLRAVPGFSPVTKIRFTYPTPSKKKLASDRDMTGRHGMSAALNYMITANILAPIIVWIFLETANLAINVNNIFAFSFFTCLLLINIYHAKTFGAYRKINILLFVLNGLSMFVTGEISFVSGLFISMLWIMSFFI